MSGSGPTSLPAVSEDPHVSFLQEPYAANSFAVEDTLTSAEGPAPARPAVPDVSTSSWRLFLSWCLLLVALLEVLSFLRCSSDINYNSGLSREAHCGVGAFCFLWYIGCESLELWKGGRIIGVLVPYGHVVVSAVVMTSSILPMVGFYLRLGGSYGGRMWLRNLWFALLIPVLVALLIG